MKEVLPPPMGGERGLAPAVAGGEASLTSPLAGAIEGCTGKEDV